MSKISFGIAFTNPRKNTPKSNAGKHVCMPEKVIRIIKSANNNQIYAQVCTLKNDNTKDCPARIPLQEAMNMVFTDCMKINNKIDKLMQIKDALAKSPFEDDMWKIPEVEEEITKCNGIKDGYKYELNVIQDELMSGKKFHTTI